MSMDSKLRTDMVAEASFISLQVVLLAVGITCLLSILFVVLLYKKRGRLARMVETLLILPLFLPPSATGYFILKVCGRNGLIGKFLYENFGITIVFSMGAAVIASVVVTIPILYQNMMSAVRAVDEEVIQAAKVCGANRFILFVRIIFPLSKQGITNGLLLSFGRAFGEFGATILVAGNIPGKTQTLPMALYYAMENNNTEEVNLLLLIILGVAMMLLNLYSWYSRIRVD